MDVILSEKDTAIIWRGPLKIGVIRQFVADVDWGPLDYLIVDAPPGTGDEPLSVAQTIEDAKAILVTTPQEVSLADVRKSINFCKQVNMDILGLVENMSAMTCPHCGQPIDVFHSGGGQKLAEDRGLNFLGGIPPGPDGGPQLRRRQGGGRFRRGRRSGGDGLQGHHRSGRQGDRVSFPVAAVRTTARRSDASRPASPPGGGSGRVISPARSFFRPRGPAGSGPEPRARRSRPGGGLTGPRARRL